MFKKIILLFLIIFAFKGCTKDDICPPDSATTPNLVITFNDIANPLIRKKVQMLTVLTDNIDSLAVFEPVSTDSIIIPLNTNSDTTKYLFKKTIVSESGIVTDSIVEKVMFVYNRKNGYVSRACGFKTEFDNLDADKEPVGSRTWIEEIDIKRQTVNDENSAHVTMLH